MYEDFYGLSGKPFQLSPDPSFFFGSKGHTSAFSYLKYGVYQGEGFLVITGDVGAGKTTLVRALLEEDLVDELRLMVFPVVLGGGKRLFGETSDTKRLRLADSKAVGDGVLILVYERAEPSA